MEQGLPKENTERSTPINAMPQAQFHLVEEFDEPRRPAVVKKDPKEVDLDKVSELIELAFSEEGKIAKLSADYFESPPNIKSILITPSQEYDAVAVIRDLGIGLGFNYICKIAVRPSARRCGSSSRILITAAEEGNVIWRARVDNEDSANSRLQKMYENNSDDHRLVTSRQGQEWVVYWKNVTASDQELELAIEFVSDLRPTITRTSTI